MGKRLPKFKTREEMWDFQDNLQLMRAEELLSDEEIAVRVGYPLKDVAKAIRASLSRIYNRRCKERINNFVPKMTLEQKAYANLKMKHGCDFSAHDVGVSKLNKQSQMR